MFGVLGPLAWPAGAAATTSTPAGNFPSWTSSRYHRTWLILFLACRLILAVQMPDPTTPCPFPMTGPTTPSAPWAALAATS